MAPEPIKDLDNLRPIDHAVIAKPHTPVYKMHRYFARRPWSVFHELVKHYSNPGSIILDPFCGGGVTVVEGLRLGRKVIGVDINPLATFITRLEVLPVNLQVLADTLNLVLTSTRDPMRCLYAATCPTCKADAQLNWLEWSNTYICSACEREIPVATRPKTRWGTYRCLDDCRAEINITESRLVSEVPIQAETWCEHCKHSSRFPTALEAKRDLVPSDDALGALEKRYGAVIPDDIMPDKLELRRPYNAHLKRYSDFFTLRNRLACAIILENVLQTPVDVRPIAIGTFISTINWAVRMCVLKKGSPAGWAAANFWTPQNPLEINVWNAFENRAKATLAGKKESNQTIGSTTRVTVSPPQGWPPETDATVLSRSSTRLPIPDSSVDAIITDPPYGGNVMYTELGNFYAVWCKETLNMPLEDLIDDAEEAIVSRPHGKTFEDYRRLMFRVFEECYRILKPDRWLVMTFHNREFKVWSAIHLAAHDAGFVLSEQDGMIYQPPIQQYTTTIYLYREGSMLGDFILSFQKVERPPAFKAIEHAEIGRNIERLAAEAVMYHHGANLSTIYMKLIPFLLNNNLLEQIGEKEVVPYLQGNFEEREGKWYLKDDPDRALRDALERYSQVHYKTSYSNAMQTVPVEARLEFLIRRLLYQKGQATQDEVLNEVYTNLINSNAADYGEIQRVLSRIAELRSEHEGLSKKAAKKSKSPRKVWRLKEDVEREKLFEKLEIEITETREESDHDLAIARLVEIAALRGLKAHIGKTEQGKYTQFRRMTSDLPQRVVGMPKDARTIVEQIDVLWHNGGKGIVGAFEVERTTTIVSGIQRFRDLLAAAPEMDIALYLVVPKERGNELRAKLGSPANRADGLHRKIGYVYLDDLKIRAKDASGVDFDKIVRRMNGGS